MAWFDLPLDKLKEYKGSSAEPSDFDTFWNEVIEKDKIKNPLNIEFTPYKSAIKLFDIYDVSFIGFGGDIINGWFILPKNTSKKIPCIVHYIGYGGGRSYPFEHLLFPSAGYSFFVMDTRGQGAMSNAGGATGDNYGSNEPQVDGLLTKGIEDKYSYYYLRVIIDALRAIECISKHPLVDENKIISNGLSQGGGLSLAVSGLSDKLFASMIDVPFLCDYKRAVTVVDTMPYGQIVTYLKHKRLNKEKVFETLSYFDGVFFARRAKIKTIFSVALMDTTCPPSTVFAAYNNYEGEKDIYVYEFNNHEGGQAEHDNIKLNFLESILK